VTELICSLGPDSAGTVLTDLLRRPRFALDVAMYEIGPSYAWAISGAARRGVAVRVLLDGHGSNGNAETVRGVTAAGGECRVLRRGDAAGHWKLLRLDGREVAVGTGNLIWRDAPRDPAGRVPPEALPLRGTREWWAVTDAPGVVDGADAAFETAWQCARRPPQQWRGRLRAQAPGDVGVPIPQLAPVRLQVAPASVRLVTGGLPVAAAMLHAIEAARSRVLVTAPYMGMRAAAVRRLVAAARDAKQRGADVRLLLGAPPQRADAARIGSTGLALRTMDPAVSTRGHAKGIVADAVAIVSSANWSRAGLGPNWEAALVVRGERVAGYLADAWERDWAAAQRLAGLASDCSGYPRRDVC
jgi:phosphatidylserine/phosphatidylglycerophosphate/cardiolipin synthase-like enzyme